MKNKIITIFFSIFFFKNAFAENISIEAKNISFDKDNNITIFENEVVVKTQNSIIKSDFAKHVKKDGLLILQKNIVILDKKNNKLLTEYAEYYEKDKIFKTKGETTIKTINNYILTGKNFFVDDTNKIISSNQKSYLEDQDKNKIYFENFQYLSEKNLFKSIGLIEIIDAKKNKYKFSQIYIDTKKKRGFRDWLKNILKWWKF